MTELSKQRKISVLQRTAEIIMKGESPFICIALEVAVSEAEGREYESCEGAIQRYVPELLKYKPQHTYFDSPA